MTDGAVGKGGKKGEKEGEFVPRKGKIGEKGAFYPVAEKFFENFRRAKSVIMTKNKEEWKCEGNKKWDWNKLSY
jgi:hypothetical protein